VTGEWRSFLGRTGVCGLSRRGAAGVSSGASCMTPAIPTPCRSPAGRLRRCVPPAPTVRRCPTPCLGPLPPARRGYGRRTSTPVVDGTGVGQARPGQGSYAPVQAIGPVWRTGSRYGPAPAPPARRGYGRRTSMPVVDGTGVGQARPGQGSYAPVQAIGPVWRTGSRYGPAPVQVCQGSYAPPSTPVAGTANWATVRPCPVHPARIAFFEQQAQPKVHRTARGVASRPRRKVVPSAIH
jgi:hypothetical protein